MTGYGRVTHASIGVGARGLKTTLFTVVSASSIVASCVHADCGKAISHREPVVSAAAATAATPMTLGDGGVSSESTATANGPDSLEASFSQAASSISGDVGIAVITDKGVRSFGVYQTGPAWSTIKVPLAIAALQRSEEVSGIVSLAIKDSDNDAAEKLWSSLGNPKQAALAVESVLKIGGDAATIVQSERVRPEFTAFGQTDWSLADQATFTSALPCIAAAAPVVDDMHHLASNQQWGLALRNDAAAKGGWGPSPDGHYLVRQIALVTTPSGNLGIAIAAQPRDGKFESGISEVGALAAWLDPHLGDFTGVRCS